MPTKGYKPTIEHRMNLSKAMSGKNHPMYGKARSEETKAKIGAAHKGKKRKPFTEETRKKIGESVRLRWQDPEFREKVSKNMSESRKGKKHSVESRAKYCGENSPAKKPEVRAKLSEIAKKKWEDPEYKASHSGENHHNFGRTDMSGENSLNWQGGISFEPYCHLFNFALKERIRNRDNRKCVLCGKSEILDGRRLSVHHIDSDKMQGCQGKKWYLCVLCQSCNAKKDTAEKEFLIVSNLNLDSRW